jgi:hypothetical protein
VLFICFNRALRDDLRRRGHGDGVKYQTFHSLAVNLARQAKVELPEYPPGEAAPEYFEEELPEALVSAIDVLGAQWHALFVHEAQDLRTNWLDALLYGLRDEREAPVWLFMDDNQRVYDAELEVPDDFFRYDLTAGDSRPTCRRWLRSPSAPESRPENPASSRARFRAAARFSGRRRVRERAFSDVSRCRPVRRHITGRIFRDTGAAPGSGRSGCVRDSGARIGAGLGCVSGGLARVAAR